MRKLLLITALSVASVAACSQGKVTLCNDQGSLYTISGQPIPISGPLPSGVVFDVGLYGGTNPASMTLQKAVLLNPTGGGGGPGNGQPPSTHVICSFPGGSLAYFQVFLWDSAYATPQAAIAAGSYEGQNNIFQMIPGSSIQYPLITSGGSSTWATVGDESPIDVEGLSPVPIQSVWVNGDTIEFSWNAIVGQLYQVQYKTDLAQTGWSILVSDVRATTTVMTASDSILSGGPHRFYRVLLLPF